MSLKIVSPEFRIGDIPVGPKHPPLVIAEMGINHAGSLSEAFKIVDAAASAGVEVIKHQTHVIEDEMTSTAKEIIPGNSNDSIYEIMSRCALSERDERLLMAYVESKGMTFLSTPFSRAAADRLEKMGVAAYKIGSGECNNYPLLKHVASFGKPIILSTGMNTLESVAKAVAIFRNYKIPYALLHTTNLYPTPPQLVRLGAMVQLADAFPEAIVGLSDHTVNNVACLGAVALGACILERHFTDSMDRSGPDIVCSMDPLACIQLIKDSRMLKQELGGDKQATTEEQITMDFAFATVVTIAPLRSGELFSMDNIWVKRPGTGDIPAAQFDSLIGKVAARDLDADIHLTYEDVVS